MRRLFEPCPYETCLLKLNALHTKAAHAEAKGTSNLSWFVFKWSRNHDAIRYCGYNDSAYNLTKNSQNCFVKEGQRPIAFFENVSTLNHALHIDHFAVAGDLRGCRRAETILRGYAQLVSQQAPQIKKITFDLHRSPSFCDIEKLASARFSLLERIGAINITKRRPNQRCVAVSAEWRKAQWTK